jgi:hypothetical protein
MNEVCVPTLCVGTHTSFIKSRLSYQLTAASISPINPLQVGKKNDLSKKSQLVFSGKAAV